jgi:hypothetical protein
VYSDIEIGTIYSGILATRNTPQILPSTKLFAAPVPQPTLSPDSFLLLVNNYCCVIAVQSYLSLVATQVFNSLYRYIIKSNSIVVLTLLPAKRQRSKEMYESINKNIFFVGYDQFNYEW